MHVSSAEYVAICRALGRAQGRCTELLHEHARQVAALERALQRQRVRALLALTRVHWGLADPASGELTLSSAPADGPARRCAAPRPR